MRHVHLLALLSLPAWVGDSIEALARPVPTIFGFHTSDGGKSPQGGLVEDSAGNFYGTTLQGGIHHDGTVFELIPPALGQTAWTQVILANFHKRDGHYPSGGLLRDSAGNLYGTTVEGGAYDHGVVFKLAPPATGSTVWTQTVLLSFNGSNGQSPVAGLIADKAGNLYGTTVGGGADYGTVFELSPPAPGQTAWTETVLFDFNGRNGGGPYGNLVFDARDNLYGTTAGGGSDGLGTAFALSPPVSGQTAWTETVLVSFNGPGGKFPEAGLTVDRAGNLYGTTNGGGRNTLGTVYELTPPASGQAKWTETVLVSFNGRNGSYPLGNVFLDNGGSVYGTTSEQGTSGFGNVFKLTPPAAGQTAWSETVIAAFNGKDGRIPDSGLIADKAGALYGTTADGSGKSRFGLVFKVSPQ